MTQTQPEKIKINEKGKVFWGVILLLHTPSMQSAHGKYQIICCNILLHRITATAVAISAYGEDMCAPLVPFTSCNSCASCLMPPLLWKKSSSSWLRKPDSLKVSALNRAAIVLYI